MQDSKSVSKTADFNTKVFGCLDTNQLIWFIEHPHLNSWAMSFGNIKGLQEQICMWPRQMSVNRTSVNLLIHNTRESIFFSGCIFIMVSNISFQGRLRETTT